MNNKVVSSILFILLIGWIAGVSYWFVCKMQNNCENQTELTNGNTFNEETKEVEKITTNRDFSINDGDVFNLESTANVSFSAGKADLQVPDSLTKNFAAIQEYISNNEDKKLLLTGVHTENEGSEIGLARAISLSDFFVANYGMEASRISTSTKQVDQLNINSFNNRTDGGVEFDFETTNIPVEENNTVVADEAKVIEEPINKEIVTKTITSTKKVDSKVLRAAKRSQMIYYPPSGFDIEPNITDDLDSYFKNLNNYFNQNPDGIIEISGHSADGFDSSENRKISEARARSMRTYLIKKYGLKRENIKIRGRGDSKLVDYSGSDMAKAKNRRITFKFIK